MACHDTDNLIAAGSKEPWDDGCQEQLVETPDTHVTPISRKVRLQSEQRSLGYWLQQSICF
jgi:hypothetical protein